MFRVRMKELRERDGYSQYSFASAFGIAQSTVGNWEAGKRKPNQETVKRLAEFFHVTTDYLIGYSDTDISGIRGDDVLYTSKGTPYRRIPVLGSVQAGVPIEAVEDVLDWEEISCIKYHDGAKYVGLRVKGDSMAPAYLPGDTLIVRVQDSASTGDDAIVFVNSDEATFKRVSITPNGLTLRPLNPDYEIRQFTNEEVQTIPVRIFGVAKEMRRSI